MRFTPVIILLLAISSCRETKTKDQPATGKAKENLQVLSDTFNFRDPDNDTAALQHDIELDTIEIAPTKRHTGISIICPVLSKQEFPVIHTKINDLIQQEKKQFDKMTKDDVVEFDSVLSMTRGWSMWIRPTLLYKTNQLVSFTFLSGSGFTGMSAGFAYHTINYDLGKKKEIGLGDYFILKSPEDSSFLATMIRRAINRDVDVKTYLEWQTDIVFGFDNNAVYFFCDKYHPWGWGIFSIEKKFILDRINQLYR
ncbi:MAG TPA: hypothetical protein VGO58_00855 [Chitinophagaceae bacterium]|jgi:hypothetical protein|nr:hypothetical protein [Chitinophagaceae bacterium]